MSKPLLGYWNIRSLAQPIRHMLAYAEVDFDEKYYEFGPAPDYFKESLWMKEDKHNLGLDFPNLPYYIDGDLKITESNAIFKYLARKHGLNGKTEEDRIKIDTLHGVFMDMYEPFVMMCYMYWDRKPAFMETLPEKLKSFSDYLGDKQWFIGDDISYVDFRYYEFLRTLSKFSVGCLDTFNNLKKFINRFEELPAIAKYMKRPDYLHTPIYMEKAKFTG